MFVVYHLINSGTFSHDRPLQNLQAAIQFKTSSAANTHYMWCGATFLQLHRMKYPSSSKTCFEEHKLGCAMPIKVWEKGKHFKLQLSFVLLLINFNETLLRSYPSMENYRNCYKKDKKFLNAKNSRKSNVPYMGVFDKN